MVRRDRAYLMAFADEDGEIYDVHLTDDLESHGTWEYIDLEFSQPHACYILVWRRDGKKFTPSEANYVTKYVREDMRDFVMESGSDAENLWHYRILKKLVDNSSCLVLQWDRLNLPDQYPNWTEFACIAKATAEEEAEEISKPVSLHDRKLDIYEGKIDLESGGSKILEEYYSRRLNPYTGYQIPSDKILKEYFVQMLLPDFDGAAKLLSEHYGISVPNVDTENDPPYNAFVHYDFVNHTIMFSLAKIPEFWQQAPAFLLGFFKHLSLSKDWRFSEDPMESVLKERKEGESFMQKSLHRLLDMGLDPRKTFGRSGFGIEGEGQ